MPQEQVLDPPVDGELREIEADMAFKQTEAEQLQAKGSPSSNSSLGRSKVALKPGRSLMDWIRFTHSASDLSRTAGKIRVVTPEELSMHNKKDDAWICLKGKVYNVTPYLEYHPGGEEELMRGAGKDATHLFNEVHRWVNAESMLQKCFVGPLNSSSLWLQSDILPSNDSIVPDDILPMFDWHQTESTVSVLVRGRKKSIKAPPLVTDLLGEKLMLTVRCMDFICKYSVELRSPVSEEYEVILNKKLSAIEILIYKRKLVHWKRLDFSLVKCITGDELVQGLSYRPCKLVKKIIVNYNTCLFSFELPPETRMFIPVGCHIQLKAFVDGHTVVRSYTPVSQSLSSDDGLSHGLPFIHLMVKIYPDGVFTPILDSCNIDDTVFISDCIGEFSLEKLKAASNVVLFAAGTGLTPMIRIIQFCLKSGESKLRKCMLMFFNKAEKDILWRDKLEALSEEEDRFSVFHVLSEPDSDWNGITGCITKQIVEDGITTDSKSSDIFFCICGPVPFTKLTGRFLRELGYAEKNIHEFLG